jgi:arginase family enzyme
MEETFDFLKLQNKESKVHISFDIDGVDSDLAKATGTRSRGGLNYTEA